MSRSVVIVGAGLCGARAAFSLRALGFDGRIALVGSERHLPYDRPPLSKQMSEASALQHIAGEASYRDAGIEHIAEATAESICRDRRELTLTDGRILPFDKMLLSTGARPRHLPGTEGMRNVFTLRMHEDALAIAARLGPGRRLVVIGGGFIGLELAATARSLGTTATVVEGMPRLMARAVPPEIAAVAEARHRQEGVDVILNAAVASVVEINDEVHVLLADGRQLIADAVVVGIGAIPNVELAAAAGLAVDNGIVVDEALITSDPDIFAAGDCCSFPLAVFDGLRMRLESWRCAQDQGTHVAGGLLGDVSPFVSVPWFWSDQYDLTLQIAGLPSLGSTTVRRDLGPDAFLLFHLDAAGRLVAASGIGIGNAVGKDIRLAEMLIAARAHPGVSDLASASIRLKSLLAA